MKIGVLAQKEYLNNGLQTFEQNLVPWLLKHEEFEPIYYEVENSYPYSRTVQTMKLRRKLREEASRFDKVFIPAQNRLRFDPEAIDAEVVPYVHDIVPHVSDYKTGRDRMLRPFLDAIKNKLDADYIRHLPKVETAFSASNVSDEDLNCRTAFSGSSQVVYQGVDDMPDIRFNEQDRDIDALYVGDPAITRKNPEMVEEAMQRLQSEGFTVASVNYNGTGLPGKSFVDVSDRKLAEIYSRSRFILHFSKMEGFGRTPVEAQRYGCIPLGLDNSINREILGRPLYSWIPVSSVSDAVSVVQEGVGQEFRDNAMSNSDRFTWERCRQQVREGLLNGFRSEEQDTQVELSEDFETLEAHEAGERAREVRTFD